MEPITPESIVSAYERFKLSQQSARYTAHTNNVTNLAHPCLAYATFCRIVPPSDRLPVDEGLSMVFAEGHDQARLIKRDLEGAGFDVEGEEGEIRWEEFNITGHRDFILRKAGFESERVEGKSSNPWTFGTIDTPEQMRDHKSHWVQKWYRQICLYMLMHNRDRYMLLMKNKSNGRIKVIVFRADDEALNAAEDMLKRAEKIEQFIKDNGKQPDMVPADWKISDYEMCSGCEMFPACNPAVKFGPGAKIISAEEATELSAMADAREDLTNYKKQYDEAHNELRDIILRVAGKDGEDVVFGDWVAHISRTEKKTMVKLLRAVPKAVDPKLAAGFNQ